MRETLELARKGKTGLNVIFLKDKDNESRK